MDEHNQVQFEEDYIKRNNHSITTRPDVSLTESVANAWDAGAHNVEITIPTEYDEYLSVEDDGGGLLTTCTNMLSRLVVLLDGRCH